MLIDGIFGVEAFNVTGALNDAEVNSGTAV
jgi:hypothetical protein